jgi:negative regulator of replication initiation
MNRSEIELTTMGKQASAEYICNKIPMNDTILKMTKEAGLNPHQVARVCEAANVNTYDTLWNMTKSADFVFDMADQEKIAEMMNDVAIPDFNENNVSVDTLSDLLPDISSIESDKTAEKTASFEKISRMHLATDKQTAINRKKVEKIASHIKQYVNELDLALKEQELVKQAAFESLTGIIKQAALSGENIGDAYIAARCVFPEKEDLIKDTFAKIAEVLKKNKISFISSFEKTASKIINEDAHGARTSDKLVIDKSHPIIKHLNTIVESDSLLDKGTKMKGYFVTKLEKAEHSLRKPEFDKGAK